MPAGSHTVRLALGPPPGDPDVTNQTDFDAIDWSGLDNVSNQMIVLAVAD